MAFAMLLATKVRDACEKLLSGDAVVYDVEHLRRIEKLQDLAIAASVEPMGIICMTQMDFHDIRNGWPSEDKT